MKTKLFIDFDGTLFDTSQIKARLFAIFGQLGFSDDEIKQSYMVECLDNKFNPDRQIERLNQVRAFDRKIAAMKISSMIFDANKMLFPDTRPFLESINRNKYEVNLLTLGDVDFQSRKVRHSGITDQFDNIYYTPIEKFNYLVDIVKKEERFLIIDDRDDALTKTKSKFPNSLTILIDRADQFNPHNSDYRGKVVRSLNQAGQYL